MKTFFRYCFFALGVIAMTACSPEDGEMGPVGPQGEQGLPGEDSNANVIASDWMPIVWDFDETTEKAMLIEDEQLSLDFFEKGGFVLMYMKFKGITDDEYRIHSLPTKTAGETIEYYYLNEGDVSGIMLLITSLTGTTVSDEYVNGEYFIQYILFPNGTEAGMNALARESIDINNNQAVSDFLNLEKLAHQEGKMNEMAEAVHNFELATIKR